MSDWIKCSDRLPADMQVVILSGHCNTPGYPNRYVEPAIHLEGCFHPCGMDDEGDLGPDMDGYMSNVTHWQPLPAPPTE